MPYTYAMFMNRISFSNFAEMTALLNISIEKLIERRNILFRFAIAFALCPRFLISYKLFHRGKSRIISRLIILSTVLSHQHDSRIHAQTRTNFGECDWVTHTRYSRVCRPLSKGSVLGLIAETRDRHVKKMPEGISSPFRSPFDTVRITDHCIIVYCDRPDQLFLLNFN